MTSTADTDTLGTLRFAINYANANPADDAITFNIPGTGPHVISPVSALPIITDEGVNIDGSTQPSASCGMAVDANGALTDRSIQIVIDGSSLPDTTDGLFISASDVMVKGLSIGNTPRHGITIVSSGDAALLVCNHIAVDASGLSLAANASRSVSILSADNVSIGDGTYAGRNIIGSPTAAIGVQATNGSGLSIRGNYIGVDATGMTRFPISFWPINLSSSIDTVKIGGTTPQERNVIVGSSNFAIFSSSFSSGITISGNYFGLGADGLTPLGTGATYLSGTNHLYGGSFAGAGNIANNGNLSHVLRFGSVTGAQVLGNKFGVGADGITPLTMRSVEVQGSSSGILIGDGSSAGENIFANSLDQGIFVTDNAQAAIVGNLFYDNAQLAIDLVQDGVTANDSGDPDTGPNDLLNFPVINAFIGDGSASVSYDINLDVPAHGDGYRVEFFKNTNLETYGQGEIYLGSADVVHAGGDLNFTGTFTANAVVNTGDFISATVTRKTGMTSFDITSEFAQTATAIAPPSPLIVTSTADTNTLGTLRFAINHANANPNDDAITFDIPGTGPHILTLNSPLPDITDDDVSIDGTSQPGAICNDLWGGTPHTILIQIDSGSTINPNYDPIQITAANTLIRGLSVTRFRNAVMALGPSSNFKLHCSYIGLAPDGSAAGNFGNGVASSGQAARIGGLNAGEGNVISSNSIAVATQNGSADTAIRGNFIGTDPTGTAARSNTLRAINHIDGTATWRDITRNLISGNDALGLSIGTINLEGDTITPSNGTIRISGNYIGVDRTGLTALPNRGFGINFNNTSSISNIVIGGTIAGDQNIISGNENSGIQLIAQNGINIFGNYIGVGADGVTNIGNGSNGLVFTNSSNINVGNGAVVGRNIISANNDHGIRVNGSSNLSILGNYIGVTASGNSALGNGDRGINLRARATSTEAHINALIDGNVIGGNLADGIDITSSSAGNISTPSSITVSNNFIGVGANGISDVGNGTSGIKNTNVAGDILIGGVGNGNTIANNTWAGVTVNRLSITTAIVENEIYNNGTLGILLLEELTNSTTVQRGGLPNDPSDSDSGPNDFLNHPSINFVDTNGGTSLSYDFNLDVPSNNEGYRIEFFKNSNLEIYGQGEIYLGSVDISHGGGNLNFTGLLSANTSVSVGDYISATTTRKTGISSFDITSEFAETQIATQNSDPLVVRNTNDSGAGSLREAISFANSNPAEDNVTFDIPVTDPGYDSARGVWRIQISSELPDITDDGIMIDGTSQTASRGNMNSGVLVPTATVGVNNTIVPAVPAPEIEIEGLGASSIALDVNSANNITLRGIAILDFGTGIRLRGGSSNAMIDQLALGTRANSSADPGAGNRIDDGIFLSGDSNSILIQNSLIANMEDGRAISAGADGAASNNSITVEGVHFINNGLDFNLTNGAIEILQSLSPTLILTGSRFVAPPAATDAGVEINPFGTGGTSCVSCVIEDNSFDGLAFALGMFGDRTIGLIFRRNIVENSGDNGVLVGPWVGGLIEDNQFIASAENGVIFFDSTARVAIVSNLFSGSGELAIDFDFDDVTFNDTNDIDTGPNERLNFPVINSFATNGTNAIDYDFNLDVPSNSDGYRIEFFKNTVPDPLGHGEGEVYLGNVDIAHAGGDLNFTGALTTNTAVTVGDNISATTTRKTGFLTYDITSEFSENRLAVSADPAVLTVTKTVDSLIAGDYFLPGNDVIYTFSVVNQGGGSVTEDSIVLIDLLPPELKFFYGDYDGPGPSSDVIGFEDTGSSLTFNPATDALYSDATTKPTSLADCDYTPTMGYDENVRFVCFNPKGEMQGGDPDPNFKLRFRAGIK